MYYVLQINLNNVMRYSARKLENHLYHDRVSDMDNMVSPAAAGSAIDSRKDERTACSSVCGSS